MRAIDCDTSGISQPIGCARWEDLPLDRTWRAVVAALRPGPVPRAVQELALGTHRILESRRNLIISAPTNSGKSLVGILALLEAIHRRQRAVLLVPLRALAREKADELQALEPQLSEALGSRLTIRISTGDYRLEDEVFSAPPPEQGELIIATPERLEAIVRNPKYDAWLTSIGAVCVDEAHLIRSQHRGSTLEYLVTSLLCLPASPRLIFLSATLSKPDRAQAWLDPCDVITVAGRYPPLHMEVLELTAEEHPDAVIAEQAQQILADSSTSLLIFVYQTRSAERLAGALRHALGDLAGCDGPLAYHGQLSSARRDAMRMAFHTGHSRCIVTTTALGLGVNLPVTHVLIRDTTFVGVGPLSIDDLLQMAGRAGRGDREGHVTILLRPTETWNADELAQGLRTQRGTDLISSFEAESSTMLRRRDYADSDLATVSTHVAAQLARHPGTGMRLDELQAFFAHSLGGKTLIQLVPAALAWLTDPTRALAFCDDQQRYQLTVLGLRATHAVLPLQLTAGIAQLLRDLLSLDATDRLLSRWKPLDHLIALELLSEKTSRTLRGFSASLADQVDAWMEAVPDRVPLLYREWIAGQSDASRASEVLGSLGVRPHRATRSGKAHEWARKEAYLAVFRAIVLYERGQGTSVEDLERRWGMNGLEGIEERWRDERLWLLSGLGRILDLRCFYYHLCSACEADPGRVRRVKRLLLQLRRQTFDLQEHLKYCSPLGPVLRSMRRVQLGSEGLPIGIRSIRHLEDGGVRNLADLASLRVDELVRMGVRRDLAHQIHTYIRRRLQ